jgi:YVTN family beta-propeller protein
LRHGRRAWLWAVGVVVLVGGAIAGDQAFVGMGKQADGSFIVSTGQHIIPGTIAFEGRPNDMAMHPSGTVVAVMNQTSVFLCGVGGIVPYSGAPLAGGSGFHGMVWSPDGKRLFVSTGNGHVQSFNYNGAALTAGATIPLDPGDTKGNLIPGGMCITHDGKNLYVTAANSNAVVQIDTGKNEPVRQIPVGTLPFEVKLAPDEKSLIVSNWGGRIPTSRDTTSPSENVPIVVDSRGAPASGTVSFVQLSNGSEASTEVGIHPCGIAVDGAVAYVADGMSDEISVLNISSHQIVRTIQLHWHGMRVIGAMPIALAIDGGKLYAADGGDNAVCQVDIASGNIDGFRPAGYFPTAIAVHAGKALVLNSKGDGSVSQTAFAGKPGNSHDFEGTVSVVDLTTSIDAATAIVAANNRWGLPNLKPALAVYNGAIKHVLYIIKENRTYDEIFGDMKEGNGDVSLCDIGENIMPNHHALARMFTLFDNGYVSGTNSADGHQWTTQAICSEYLEHFYPGYSRTYPDDGSDAMTISTGGCIWDAALLKGKVVRDYAEFTSQAANTYSPRQPKDWFEAYNDYKNNTHIFKYTAHSSVESLRDHVDPNVQWWPLLMCDQMRASEFIREYSVFSQEDKVPDLTILSLPCDHTQGVTQGYPTPRAMMADNDLALGRVVEAVSHSPQWKDTCIFVIEDDAQSGPDHVDGHRTAFQIFSPYVRRGAVDSELYTTVNMIKSIEVMLGLDPMNRFDLLARPIDSCFVDKPDLTPYNAVPNNIPLDERPPGTLAMTPAMRHWANVSAHLDWGFLDAPDSDKLNRVIWASLHPNGTPYPYPETAALAHRDPDGDGE